jgi:hypothetical protein
MFATIACLASLIILNVLDAIFTIHVLRVGLAEWETNPLARILLNIGNEWFVIWKVSQVSLLALIFWKGRNLKLAQFGMAICFLVYVAIIAWHKWGMS